MGLESYLILFGVFCFLFQYFSVKSSVSFLDLSICDIQGSTYTSPYLGEEIRTSGIVYADFDDRSLRGFFLEDVQCDNNPNTSDGIFVYLGDKVDVVDIGDYVEVVGVVGEYYGQTEVQSSAPQVVILSKENALPSPIALTPPKNNDESREYFESLESMYVSFYDATVVGPTDHDDRSWLVAQNLGINHVFESDNDGTGEIVCVDDRGYFELAPEVKTGDSVEGLLGPLQFSYKQYCIQLIEAPTVTINTNEDQYYQSFLSMHINVGTFNLENLFDTIDDPAKDDSVLTGTRYSRKLHKLAETLHVTMDEPTVLAIQEVENSTVITDLINQPEIATTYNFIHFDGPDKRGIDSGLLFDDEKIQLLDAYPLQGCTDLVDGLGPDGNRDVAHPVNEITCDTNDDGIFDGNRLFSRPPLVAHLSLKSQSTGDKLTIGGNAPRLWIIVNHWKSKLEDTRSNQYTLPRRMEQAQFVRDVVNNLITDFPDEVIILVGDLNDYPDSEPVNLVTSEGFSNLLLRIPRVNRYTYIYEGVSQVMDYILIREPTDWQVIQAKAVHVNADFPCSYENDETSYHRSSDHDPVVVEFAISERTSYLPFVSK